MSVPSFWLRNTGAVMPLAATVWVSPAVSARQLAELLDHEQIS